MPRFSALALFRYLGCVLSLCLFISAAWGEDSRHLRPATAPAKRHLRDTGALYLDITNDKTGAVAQVDFLNHPPPEIQEYIRRKIIGQHFDVPNHCYRRYVRYEWYNTQ